MHKRADARKAPRQDTFPQWCICLDVASETTIHVNELLLALKVRAFRQEEEGGKWGNKNTLTVTATFQTFQTLIRHACKQANIDVINNNKTNISRNTQSA